MLQMQEPNRGGMVVGPPHNPDGSPGGGVHFTIQDTGKHIEEEGFEINIPNEVRDMPGIFTFTGKNIDVLNQILALANPPLSITDKVQNVRSRDVVICVRSAWADEVKEYTGTIEQILHQINTSKGCKPIPDKNAAPIAKKGGTIPAGAKPREKDWQALDPHSPRWKKKKKRLQELSNNIHRLRLNVSRDIQNSDERTALTALVVAIMDRSAERIGNDDSADNGHFGVTGFRKKHITVVGNKVHLEYVGKSGTKHDKSISDIRIAKALKKAIRNAPGKFIFQTSDGFRIRCDKVNRYLQPFNISAKDMRGYNANKWIIDQLKSQNSKVTNEQPDKARKERKKVFNKAVKETAARVGHGAATLKKHYMVPELPVEYIERGNIINLKNVGYYNEGGSLGDLKSEDYFANKNIVPDAVHKKSEEIFQEAQDEGIDKLFNAQLVKQVAWEDVVPTQDFLRTSKFHQLENVKDIYSINLPWAIEYNGKYYINDGHHRAVSMHNRNLPIKLHVYPMESETETIPAAELKKGIEVEKEHKNLYFEIKRRLSEIGIEMPISEHEFYSEIAKAHIKEKKDYYDLLEKYVEKYRMQEGGTTPSVEEKIAQRLQERQKAKEFKDTGVATYTRKYHAAYDIVTSSDLADIENDNVTAYKLIEKSKIWPAYNPNELKQQGNTSGAAYMKVKCREALSARPLDSKAAREIYVKNIEKLRTGLEAIKTASDIREYLNEFVNLDTFDLGDLSGFKGSYYISSSYKGNLAKYNEKQVTEYFNDIFGKKFYNFCKQKSDSAKIVYAEALLYESFSKQERDQLIEARVTNTQTALKRYQALKDKVQAATGTDEIKKAIAESGIPYYEYKYDKEHVLEYLTKYITFLNTQTREKIDSSLSKHYTVREEDWSWAATGTEKKAAAPKDEEGKPRQPQNIFEKYGIEQPKVLKRTPLEYVKRTGGLEVGDISTKAVLENFGFKNIIYGNYVNDAESKEHTKHILGAMLDMVEICNIDIKDINKLGGLDINIGSTGCGPFSGASACYFPSLKAINLTKKRGDGSLGHEWAHYLDNTLAQGVERSATNIPYATLNPVKSERITMLFAEYKNWLLNGGILRKIKVVYYPQKKFMYRIFGETLPAAIEAIQKRYAAYKDYKNFSSNDLIRYYGYLAYKLNDNKPLEVEFETKATQFYIATSAFGNIDYFLNPKEMFARAFEGWLEYKLQKMGRASNYLVDVKSGMGLLAMKIPRNEWPYPEGSDVIWLNDWFERLFSAIRVDYNIKPFTWGTKERVDEYTDYKDTKNSKVDAGVEVKSDGTVVVEGEVEEFEKGYGFRIGTLKDAKGENRNIYRLITNPYSRGEGFAVGGVKSDVFIFALKYFTAQKSGYGIADGMAGELPNIVSTFPDAKLEEVKKETIEYFKSNKESKPVIMEHTPAPVAPTHEKKSGNPSIHSCAVRLGRKGGLASAKVRAKMDNGGEMIDTATEIRDQLGHKALFMLGAYDIFASKGDLVFKIKGSPRWKHIKIHLNPNDLYDMTFTTWRKKDLSDIKDKTIKDIGAEQMHSIIEQETGLYTSLENGGTVYDEDPHDGSDVDPDSTEYLIDMELKPLIDKVRRKAFMPEYQSQISDADVLGIIVSKYNRWNGDKIKETCYSAFEDANFSDAAEQVSKFDQGGEVTRTKIGDYRIEVSPAIYAPEKTQIVIRNQKGLIGRFVFPSIKYPEPITIEQALEEFKKEESKDVLHNGGPIINQYAGKTAKQVWDEWTPYQRNLFYHDHFTQEELNDLPEISVRIMEYNQLPEWARKKLNHHVKLGQYSDGGSADEQQESPQGTCGCFHSFLAKEKPELVEQLEKADVNSNPELRAQVDEAYQAWKGGSMDNGGPLPTSMEMTEKETRMYVQNMPEEDFQRLKPEYKEKYSKYRNIPPIEWMAGKSHAGGVNGYGKEGLKNIIAYSKQNPANTYKVTDDNYSHIGNFWLKNGRFAAIKTLGNPNYDFMHNQVRLSGKEDVIYKFKQMNK